jgi:hypothetical protein
VTPAVLLPIVLGVWALRRAARARARKMRRPARLWAVAGAAACLGALAWSAASNGARGAVLAGALMILAGWAMALAGDRKAAGA